MQPLLTPGGPPDVGGLQLVRWEETHSLGGSWRFATAHAPEQCLTARLPQPADILGVKEGDCSHKIKNSMFPFDRTTFSIDLIGRYVCNTWDEAINSGGAPFDVVVIGAGMHGGYCAEKIFRFAKEAGKSPRILS
jgi:hypothetical protein